MARAPRKRPPATAAAKRTTTTTKPTTPPTDAPEATTPPTEATSPTIPVDELVATYWRALDERDVVTGTIPAVQLDAVRLAYRAVPHHQRGNLATKLNAQAAEKMVLGDGTVDAGLAVAMGHLAALFATANASNGTHQRAPHDPVPEVAAILVTLDATRDLLLAAVSDDQRERIADAATTGTQATRDKVAAKLAPIVNRALNGTPSRSAARTGTRTGGPARDLGAIVRDAVQAAGGETLFLSTIGREHGISTGALGNRWAKDNIPGVKAVEVDGRKAFATAA